jgi:hypothetical protein
MAAPTRAASLLGAQFQLRGAAFSDPKIKITIRKQDEAFGARRRGLPCVNREEEAYAQRRRFLPDPAWN